MKEEARSKKEEVIEEGRSKKLLKKEEARSKKQEVNKFYGII
ncbi:hypothetical protein [Okeania sp. SIO2C2]|nr:hypothetical protein [Okeania sp. SIO2C2]